MGRIRLVRHYRLQLNVVSRIWLFRLTVPSQVLPFPVYHCCASVRRVQIRGRPSLAITTSAVEIH